MSRAVALYDCTGDDPSELTFRKGDIIEQIKTTDDDGWYTGALVRTGAMGFFPGNYVEFLPEDLGGKIPAKSTWGNTVAGPTLTNRTPGSTNPVLSGPTLASSSQKKWNAIDMRANLMQKSESLALSAREKGIVEKQQPGIVAPTNTAMGSYESAGSNSSGGPMRGIDKSKQPLASIMHSPFLSTTKKDGPSSTEHLEKSFSETSLKSNESLLSEKGPEKNPRIGKRPPLLLANQKYATIVNESDPDKYEQNQINEPLEPVMKTKSPINSKPPPRPSKPAELRSIKSPNQVQLPSAFLQQDQVPSQSQIDTGYALSSEKNRPPIPSRPPTSSKPTTAFAQPSSKVEEISQGAPPLARRPETISSSYPSKTINILNFSHDAIQRYRNLFYDLDTDKDGYLNGQQVKDIWLRSGLDSRLLGQIWGLSDIDDDGLLDVKEFCIGMFIIDERLRGCSIPTNLPNGLLEKINL